MSLFAYNLTGSPVALAAGSPIVTVPASAAPPARGKAYNVTAEIRPNLTVDPVNGKTGGLAASAYLLLQAQVTNGQVVFEWTSEPEYLTPGLTVSTPGDEDPNLVKQTTAVLHVYADGTLGNNANSGLQTSAGTGGSFSVLAGVVTFTGTGATWTAADVGRLITINYATNPANNGTFQITLPVTPTTVTYANARGVTEAMPAGGKWAVSSPKLTLSAVEALVPFFASHNVCVHLSGTFTNPGPIHFEKFSSKTNIVLVDGGTATTIVADNAGSPWTADIATLGTIGLTTAGWTPNAYEGYLVEIVSGTGAGQTRMIQGNTATTLTVCREYPVIPTGSLFRIVRPTTTINASSASSLRPRNLGIGVMQVQNLYLSGTSASIQVNGSLGPINFSHVCNNSASGYNLSQSPGFLTMTGTRINPHTFASESTNTFSMAGISQIASTGIVFCRAIPGTVIFGQSVMRRVYMFKSSNFGFQQGSRVECLLLVGCMNNTYAPPDTSSAAGYAKIEFGGYTGIPGVIVASSTFGVGANVNIDYGTHGVEVFDNSSFYMAAVVTGVNNIGAGIYAHDSANVWFKPSLVPTLTGVAYGNISVDGATQATTWSAVAGGSSYTHTGELVRVKAYVNVLD